MSAAGDAVLAMARSQIGVTEYPPGSNNVPYWDWYGGNYGSWCACFVSWCNWHAGYPMCAVDSDKGFILVSNGTTHSYPEGEAQYTADLQPGDAVLFSWYAWQWVNGIPIITDPEWAGWVAGDHTGIFAYWIDQSTGQFACVEGNTSQTSWDNGGAVLERTDRYTSQVCGWWRVPAIEYAEAGPGPEDEEMTEADWSRMAQLINDCVANVWRAAEMESMDVTRAHIGSHGGCLDVVRSEEFTNIIRTASGG